MVYFKNAKYLYAQKVDLEEVIKNEKYIDIIYGNDYVKIERHLKMKKQEVDKFNSSSGLEVPRIIGLLTFTIATLAIINTFQQQKPVIVATSIVILIALYLYIKFSRTFLKWFASINYEEIVALEMALSKIDKKEKLTTEQNSITCLESDFKESEQYLKIIYFRLLSLISNKQPESNELLILAFYKQEIEGKIKLDKFLNYDIGFSNAKKNNDKIKSILRKYFVNYL